MNKEQTTQLSQKMTKWNWTTKQAQDDPLRFVLDRALKDYLAVCGTSTGAPEYLATALRETNVIQKADELVQTVLDDASEAVREAFDVYPENHVAHLLGEELAVRISSVEKTDTGEIPVVVVNDLTEPAHLNLDSLMRGVTSTTSYMPSGWEQVLDVSDDDESDSNTPVMLDAMVLHPPVSANEANRLYYSHYTE